MDITIKPINKINAVITVPGDKSISHRAVMFGSIAKGDTEISGFLTGDDCMSTISCFKKLGIDIETNGENVLVHGKGLHGLTAPTELLDVGNSGTTIRLISGLLSGQDFNCRLNGDASIQKRPMNRVIKPLSQMGAKIASTNDGYAPLEITGAKLKGIEYHMPVASAQVKSSILLASLYAEGETVVIEDMPSRDHTEIMLNYFGADIKNENGRITSRPVKELYGKPLTVPGDISSAAFFIAAALLTPNSEITITNVGINKTRTGIIDAFLEMGADIKITNERLAGGEPVGDLVVKTSKLKAITLGGDIIPRMIDEIPVFVVAALAAEGTTVVKDAQELKVKESNRIATMTEELGKMGAKITETEDGMIIEGGQTLTGGTVYSHLDHRVAMSAAIAALNAKGETTITDADCVGISFPNFYELLNSLR
ncbi:MAG: 3-phosphoshikimate 1-carboxyvinyltransferase [Firmicutes bacterium]|nr:3-phosphoshikimate 1-carboxyvinyltransferase [Bacillota bacterium]MBQ9605318.1 3-phosphoshikimate 1-carboxyvinyltransferase [Bacillota bacterium]